MHRLVPPPSPTLGSPGDKTDSLADKIIAYVDENIEKFTQTPYAVTCPTNQTQTKLLDQLNTLLDSYTSKPSEHKKAKILKAFDDAIAELKKTTSFSSTHVNLLPKFCAVLEDAKTKFQSTGALPLRVIPITTIRHQKDFGIAPATLDDDKLNVARAMTSVKKYHFHALQYNAWRDRFNSIVPNGISNSRLFQYSYYCNAQHPFYTIYQRKNELHGFFNLIVPGTEENLADNLPPFAQPGPSLFTRLMNAIRHGISRIIQTLTGTQLDDDIASESSASSPVGAATHGFPRLPPPPFAGGYRGSAVIGGTTSTPPPLPPPHTPRLRT